ncbi:hypothetical protein LPJ66_004057 [Kickxella alabastrina]|uniref:Uncharacterized protein n=1 Tax=Kickxella alabastrina TaxID=61397 RepID=A0ACC1IM66_9FUNG|nr:hypothetical protein LPJ66_004057 [Kickxella alabastrina]
MDDKQNIAKNEKAVADSYNNPNPLPDGTLPRSNINNNSNQHEYTNLYDDAPVSRAAHGGSTPGYTSNANSGNPYGQQQQNYPPTAGPSSGPSPYGPYGDSNPPAYPPGAPPTAAPGQTTVIDGVTGVKVPKDSYIEVTDVPANVKCPNCHKDIVTQIETKTGARTVVAAAAIFVVFWPLAWVPFVSKHMKKKIHVCPYCHHKLGKVISLTAVGPFDKK